MRSGKLAATAQHIVAEQSALIEAALQRCVQYVDISRLSQASEDGAVDWSGGSASQTNRRWILVDDVRVYEVVTRHMAATVTISHAWLREPCEFSRRGLPRPAL